MHVRSAILLALGVVAGCAYVTQEEFDAYWDADRDSWPLDQDCNDDNPAIYPFAPDVRGDGCDADCGEEPDADGDDWPDAADCDPNDRHVYPCSPNEIEGDGTDSDCDGQDGARDDICAGLDPDFPDADPIAEGKCTS